MLECHTKSKKKKSKIKKFCLNLLNQMRKYMNIIQVNIIKLTIQVNIITLCYNKKISLLPHSVPRSQNLNIKNSYFWCLQCMSVEAFVHPVTQSSRLPPSNSLSPEHMSSLGTKTLKISSGCF